MNENVGARVLIRNARLFGEEKLSDLLIKDGLFNNIGVNLQLEANEVEVIDAKGMLLTPTFVDPHLHIDKAFTAKNGRISKKETLEDSISIMHKVKKQYTKEDVKERAVKAIKDSVKYGATKVRANVDIDNYCNLVALEGCLLAKEETQDIADVQLVAFPQEGIFSNPGTDKLMEEALRIGADVVGGMPAAEWIEDESRRHVDFVFELAEKYDRDIDMHIDQTKDYSSMSLEYAAFKSIKEGYQGRVTGGHCTSLAYQNKSHASKVIELLRIAEFNVCANPQVLSIMGIDEEPRTRGLTRIRELVEAGVNVGIAQDTISDGFHLFGTGDPLDYGLLMAYAAQYNSTDTVRIIFDMITYNSAKIMRLTDYGIKIGNSADFNLIFAENEGEALRLRPGRLVFKKGKVIARIEKQESFP